MTDAEPTMEAKQLRLFSEWYVEITWPGGHKDRIDGFKTEAHARGWITHESPAWIARLRGPRR